MIANALLEVMPVGTATGPIANFETELAVPLVNVSCNIVATGGNGTPDSPIPINGYSSANITRCGVNLFDKANVISAYCDYSSKIIYNNAFKSVVVPLINGAQYTFSQSLLGVFDRFAVCDSLVDMTTIYDPINPNNTGLYSGTIPFTFTNSANKKYLICSVWRNTDTYTFDEIANTCQLEVGSTASEYHAYNGQTYTISFGQTVYGGVLDVTRGKLRVTHGIIDLSSLAWSKDYYSSTQKYYYYASPISGAVGYSGWTEVGNIKCDSYPTVSRRDVLTGNLGITLSANVNGGTPNIYNPAFDNAETTANDVKTAMNGVMLVYELATPFDIDLTPEVISAIVGVNNVYSDTNGDMTVQYKDSIQHYINQRV